MPLDGDSGVGPFQRQRLLHSPLNPGAAHSAQVLCRTRLYPYVRRTPSPLWSISARSVFRMMLVPPLHYPVPYPHRLQCGRTPGRKPVSPLPRLWERARVRVMARNPDRRVIRGARREQMKVVPAVHVGLNGDKHRNAGLHGMSGLLRPGPMIGGPVP